MKTVLFAGAGFSAEAGLPTMRQFGETFRGLYDASSDRPESAPWLCRLDPREKYAITAAVSYMDRVLGVPDEMSFNIEWVLGQLEMMRCIVPRADCLFLDCALPEDVPKPSGFRANVHRCYRYALSGVKKIYADPVTPITNAHALARFLVLLCQLRN